MLESLRSSVCRGWCPRPARRKWGGVAKCHGSWASYPEGCRAESEHTEGRGPSLVTSTARDQGHRVPIAAKLRIPGLEDVNGDALKGSMETEARRSCRGRHGEERERARFRVAFGCSGGAACEAGGPAERSRGPCSRVIRVQLAVGVMRADRRESTEHRGGIGLNSEGATMRRLGGGREEERVTRRGGKLGGGGASKATAGLAAAGSSPSPNAVAWPRALRPSLTCPAGLPAACLPATRGLTERHQRALRLRASVKSGQEAPPRAKSSELGPGLRRRGPEPAVDSTRVRGRRPQAAQHMRFTAASGAASFIIRQTFAKHPTCAKCRFRCSICVTERRSGGSRLAAALAWGGRDLPRGGQPAEPSRASRCPCRTHGRGLARAQHPPS